MKEEKKQYITKAEEQVMQVLWDLEEGFVKDIVEKFPNPKPAYNTISTIVRNLEKKEYIGHKVYGNTHQYFPLIARDFYKNEIMANYLKNYFSNSFKQLVSFFSEKNNLTINEIEEIRKIMENEIKKQKNN